MSDKNNQLPDLIIIGAQKCGTTSLHYYLSLHPQISMSHPKELNFFLDESDWSKGNWHKGVEWYNSHFTGNAKIHGETSPNYTNYPQSRKVAERMFTLLPEMKLIYILRDPIKRIISQYIHERERGKEDRTLADALVNQRNNEYIQRSMYYQQIAQYLNYFDPSNLLIITMESLSSNCRQTMRQVFQFLGVNADFYSQKFIEKQHTSDKKKGKTPIGHFLEQRAFMQMIEHLFPRRGWKIKQLLLRPFLLDILEPEMDAGMHAMLTELLQDDVNQLRKFTGRDFADWSI